MIVFPCAKINLGLQVLDRRPDGYHNISTVMMPVPWLCDVLEILPSDDSNSSLLRGGIKIDCGIEKNLVWRAWRALEAPPVQMALYKTIPLGSGLGGGSSDAAYALCALDEIFEMGMSDKQLQDIAGTLGADCPFFIKCKPQIATETGTKLRGINISLQGWTLLIVKPADVNINTAKAYAELDNTPRPWRPRPSTIVRLPVEEWRGELANDFEDYAVRHHPVIGEILTRLYDMGATYASLTGSGSACYGLYRTLPSNEALHKAFPDCFKMAGPMI